MRASGLFASGLIATVLVGGALAAPVQDSLTERREQVAKMTPAEQHDLLRRQERFLALPAGEQERLRELQSALDADPRATELQQVLTQYHEWLKTISATQRAELADLPPKQRLAQVKRIKQQQDAAREQARRVEVLSGKDSREVMRWTEEMLWARRERYLKEMSPERREEFEGQDRSSQRRTLMRFAFERARRGSSSGLSDVPQADIDALAKKLSPPARDLLAEAQDAGAQRRIVMSWIATSSRRQDPRSRGGRRGPSWVDHDMMQFFQREMKPEDRERILKLPREQMVDEIRRMFWERQRAGGRPSESRVPSEP